jgi:hypothetical protein
MTIRIAAASLLALLLAAPAQGQAPWLTADVRTAHDSQDRTALHAHGQYGRYLTRLLTVALDLTGTHIAAPGPGTADAAAGATATFALPAARLGIEAAAHALAATETVTPVYRLAASLGLGSGFGLRGRIVRNRYTRTVASLDTLVMVGTVELSLDRSGAPGWAGEALVRRESYGDDNPVRTVYAWVLAPISRSAGHSLRAGYAAAWQDAPRSRWTPDPGAQPGQGQQLRGRYAPYYTPHDVVTHSVLANAALAHGAAWFIADGSYGVRATETAPVLVRSGAVTELRFYHRSFTPWRAALTFATPLDERTALTVTGEYSRTAFYRAGELRVRVARAL